MTPDPGRAALVRELAHCIRRRVRAERLLAKRLEAERAAEAQLRAWQDDLAADQLADARAKVEARLTEQRRQVAAILGRRAA